MICVAAHNETRLVKIIQNASMTSCCVASPSSHLVCCELAKAARIIMSHITVC